MPRTTYYDKYVQKCVDMAAILHQHALGSVTRIAKGRYRCQRPAVEQVKRARALLKCDAGIGRRG